MKKLVFTAASALVIAATLLSQHTLPPSPPVPAPAPAQAPAPAPAARPAEAAPVARRAEAATATPARPDVLRGVREDLQPVARVHAPKAPTGPVTPEALREAERLRKVARRQDGWAKPRPDKPDEFAKLHLALRSRTGEARPAYAPNYRITALRATAAAAKTGGNVTFTEHGPGNVSGRTRGLIVDLAADPSASTWFAGSVSGGIWKTTDAGLTWRNLTPDLPNLATVALAQAASNPDVLYAGTGEGFFVYDATGGDGIWKSTDRGKTWHQLASTASNFSFRYVNRLVVDPADAGRIVAATNTGLYRSTDGGATWTETMTTLQYIQQVVASPSGFDTLYAAVYGTGIVRSVDGGASWAWMFEPDDAGRLELAVAPSNPSRLYVGYESFEYGSALFTSYDAGATWTQVLHTGTSNSDWLGGQGWYDNTLAVHPYDEDIVFVGGVNLWRIDVTSRGRQHARLGEVEEHNTGSFLDFVNFGGKSGRGGVDLGIDGLDGLPTGLEPGDYATVEIRFGPGRRQRAHRFVGAAEWRYVYRDYVDVPFEVWDVDRNQQLMVSFRDTEDDGTYDLSLFDVDDLDREYIFVHAVPYGEQADPNIAQTGGQVYRAAYFLWPILAGGGTWASEALPDATLRINVDLVDAGTRTTTRLTNWYPGEPHPDGGVYPYVHADHHNLAVIPLDAATRRTRIVNANDGGVEYSDDGGVTWHKTLNGYNTTQFYGADKHPTADRFIGGMQDNGTWVSHGSDAGPNARWTEFLGGDGFSAVWHSEDPNRMMATVYYNSLYRTLDGGATLEAATTGLGDVGGSAPFVTHIGKTASDPDLLFVGGPSGVWRSDDFGGRWRLAAFTDEGNHWNGRSGVLIRTAISDADPQVVWASELITDPSWDPDYDFRPYVSTDGGLTFSPAASPPGVYTTTAGLATHPSDPQTAYLVFAVADEPKIWRTTDLGATWESLTGTFEPGAAVSSNGFPNVATYAALVMPHDPDVIWAGTEIGLYVSTDGGGSWARLEGGLPAVSIWQLSRVGDEVVIATHGRGVWTAKVPELAGYAPPAVTRAPRLDGVGLLADGLVTLHAGLRAAYDSTVVLLGGEPYLTLGPNAAPVDTVFAFTIDVPEPVEATVALRSYRDGRAFGSGVETVVLHTVAAVDGFASDFEADEGAFVGDGFTAGTVPGFDDGAIHTLHPYENASQPTYRLATPIRVASGNAVLRYRDVAIVEPGEEGTPFGDPYFYDYVVVEGSKDGIHWQALAPGYDARAHEAWLEAYYNGEDGAEHLFVEHEIDLLDTFEPGDVVLIRFRLFADAASNAWGWAIDDLSIQADRIVSREAEGGVPDRFVLEQNYPNPFNPSTTIAFALPEAGPVSIRVFDAQGRLVARLADGVYPAGRHRLTWNAAHLASGVYFYTLEAKGTRLQRSLVLLK